MKLARWIARFAHAVVTEFREMEAEPETEKSPIGFTIPVRTEPGPCNGENCDHISHLGQWFGK